MGNDMVYNGMLFLHILGAMGYVSGLAIIYVCVLGLRRAHTIHTLRLWTGTAARVTSTVVPISGVGVTAMGLYLYIVAWRGTEGNWVLVALGAFLGVGLVIGLLVSPLFTRRVDSVGPVAAPEKTTSSA